MTFRRLGALADSEAAQPFWLEAAAASTLEDLAAAITSANEHDGAAPAGTIRDLLNLDAYDKEDYLP